MLLLVQNILQEFVSTVLRNSERCKVLGMMQDLKDRSFLPQMVEIGAFSDPIPSYGLESKCSSCQKPVKRWQVRSIGSNSDKAGVLH